MATRHAQSQVHPGVADSQAIFTAIGARRDFADLIEMIALFSHLIDLARVSSPPSGPGLLTRCCAQIANASERKLTTCATSAADNHQSYPTNPGAAG